MSVAMVDTMADYWAEHLADHLGGMADMMVATMANCWAVHLDVLMVPLWVAFLDSSKAASLVSKTE
jgi:hypothetical protein